MICLVKGGSLAPQKVCQFFDSFDGTRAIKGILHSQLRIPLMVSLVKGGSLSPEKVCQFFDKATNRKWIIEM